MKKLSIGFLLLILTVAVAVGCAGAGDSAEGKIVVSGKDWTEQWILAHIYGEYLKAHTDLDVEVKEGLGSETVLTEAMKKGDVDMYVEYSGTGYLVFLKQQYIPDTDPAEIYEQTKKGYLKEFNFQWLEPIGFANNHALAVTADTAKKKNLKTLSDLKGKAEQMSIGAPGTFYEREDGYKGYTKQYGYEFGKTVSLDEDVMYTAVKNGEVDLIVAFSTDPRIEQFNLQPLEDDKKYFPPYDAAPVIRKEVLDANPGLEETINELAGNISTEEMMAMNAEVNQKNKKPQDVAREFLEKKGLL
ncbi:glycine betaine ABC transporter substrate-binding protein [Desmospora activa]|uniref:Osmoprotectant transport system substrate-binding protein n=1 Tax=Desmospora activa DSM 45169 TaxID=1121389 RepID=A0A2T4Z3R6_9BACL|nr:glycine betaine ABC transporter substrate-binding protein [Desmospora activa]PTM56539.1 osmoprotectant transport system substrate-binding protein [Desmospora activa DSM 45169]